MIAASRDERESRRLAVLRAYRILDTPADPRYDRMTQVAARLTGACAAIAFFDESRVWLKSTHGPACAQIAHAVLDEVFVESGVVGGAPDRPYAAVALRSPSGHVVGALVVFDAAARPDFNLSTIEALEPVAGQIIELLEHDAAKREIALRNEEVSRLEARVARLQAADPSPAAMPCALFLERLSKTLQLRSFSSDTVLLFLDVHAFTRLNAAFGRSAGDEALREIAARIRGEIAPCDAVARRDADHFAIVMQEFDALAVAQLRERLEEPLTYGAARGVRLSFKIGGVRLCDVPYGERADRVLQMAESAAQESAGSVIFANRLHRSQVRADEAILLQLVQAVENGSIDLHYQPLVDAVSGRSMGFEALARWKSPDGVAVEPSQFVALADRYGQAFPLGEQLLRKACSTCCDFVGVDPRFVLHVNISPIQLLHPLFEVCVNDALRLSGMPAKNLCFEITEAAVADPERIGPKIARLRERGLRFALDDFGMGYSSLSHIRRLPVDAIKIDRFFVSGAGEAIADPPIVRTVITLAKELGLTVVAEGVETADQAAFLRELGCDILQGFLFGRPAPVSEWSI